ncbi:MAG TPA: hypothetical protein VGB92_26635, partial [Longimicrobium sp.]
MYTFKCDNCGRIKDFPNARYGEKCLVCFKGKLHEYDGPMAAATLKAEDDSLAHLTGQIETLEAQITASVQTKKLLEGEYKQGGNQDQIQVFMRQIGLCNDVITSATEEISKLKRQLETHVATRQSIHRDATAVATAAKGVLQTSTKNKLYIGSKEYVSKYASSRAKKLRILDAGNWSWGLNLAWVEGGIDAGAEFKLKLSDTNPYFSIPKVVLQNMEMQPGMQPDTFLELCRKHGKKSLLWYDGEGENRPTWTALEIAALLR